MEQVDLWELVGGLGLFLFSMSQLEKALRAIAGRSFKKLLQSYTNHPLKAAIAGTATTAVLQSSSIVGLMVLAFVGAGLMTLQNALGVIFGANFGTTLTGWIVTTLGFKLDLEGLALPLIGIGGLSYAMLQNRLGQTGRIVAALGLLLLGLTFMKDSVAALSDAIDVSRFEDYAPWQFLLFGTVVAAVIQSSSATMLITLAALNSGVIDLPAAAAVAIGADLGTTTTVLLGAVQGSGGKRRVALAHFVFNLTTDVIAFIFRVPLLALVAALGISDPLFALVAFHSLFNLLGVLMFLPFTAALAGFLSRRFSEPDEQEARYLGDASPLVSEAALVAVEEETAHLIARVVRLNMHVFSPALPEPPGALPFSSQPELANSIDDFDRAYRKTKRLEGEIIAFALKVQQQPMEEPESERLSQLVSAVRRAVHSAKSLRDIHHNLLEFEDSPNQRLNAYIDHFRSVMTGFYGDLYSLAPGLAPGIFRDFAELIERVHRWHDQLHREVISDIGKGHVDESEVSSLLNVNREVLNSNLAVIMALQEYHLDPAISDALSQLRGAS